MTDSCYLIAEIGLNHNGDLSLAKELVDAAADAGADAAKFQKRDVDTLAIEDVLDAPDNRFPSFGSTYREVRAAHEFDLEEFREIKSHAETRGVDFLCTPFDIPSVEFLEELGVDQYKIASHSVTNLPMLEAVAETGKPVYMSSGMCTPEEFDEAVEVFESAGTDLTLFHCVSAYPQSLEESNIRKIDTLQERYGLPVGYSGHEFGYLPTLAAVARGAVAVERHFTLDTEMDGFDHELSLEPDEFAEMAEAIRDIQTTLGTGESEIRESERKTREKYHVSMVAAETIPAGAELTEAQITYKNPGTGLLPREAERVLGREVTEEIPADTIITPEMVQ